MSIISETLVGHFDGVFWGTIVVWYMYQIMLISIKDLLYGL